MQEGTTLFGSRGPGTIVFTGIAFVLFVALIWHLASVLNDAKSDQSARSANRLAALLGALCGWIIGTFFSPFSDAERNQFATISSVVSAFLSGYVVSKVDRFVEGKLFPVGPETRDSWARVGLFASAFLLAAITVFVFRLYAFQVTAGSGASPSTAIVTPAPNAATAAASAVAAAISAAAAGRASSPPAAASEGSR
jgi:hypothetical protein